MNAKFAKTALCVVALAAVTWMLMRPVPETPHTKAVKRMYAEAKKVRSTVAEDPTVPQLEHYITGLKSISLEGLPPEVETTFARFIQALERDLEIHRLGINRTESLAGIKEAEITFGQSVGKYTTTPF